MDTAELENLLREYAESFPDPANDPATVERRVRRIVALTELEIQQSDDYEWCLHDADLRKRYGGKVVAAHRHRILGVGASHAEALEAAQRRPDCPPLEEIAIVVVPEHVPDITPE